MYVHDTKLTLAFPHGRGRKKRKEKKKERKRKKEQVYSKSNCGEI